MKAHRLSLITGAVVLALGLSTSAMANDTSSAIRGSIVNSAGAISSNAQIEIFIIHINDHLSKAGQPNNTHNSNWCVSQPVNINAIL